MNRRNFLTTSAVAASSLAIRSTSAAENPNALRQKLRVKLAIATYSYWHFRDPKVSVEAVIEKAADLGVEGVDFLHRQMDLPEKEPLTAAHRAYLSRLKRHSFACGVAPVCLSTHQGFVNPDPAVIATNVEHTKKCIEICYALGIPALRLNTGRWGTTKDFDELMRNHGEEAVLPGHTIEEGFKWCMDGIQQCLAKAEECGVTLALENHWGLARTADGLLRILDGIKSPWLGALMDTGNFLTAPYVNADYEQLAQIAPRAVFVQAKTYPGGGEWYTLKMDYARIARMLAKVNYRGYVSLEMEGKEDPDTAVPKSIVLLRKAFA
ncbi:MAG: sugar phosphate isomerase/epimerase [Pedosphaera sp.]|nr:sugar phosphate isomerase/epimerase [Pedosphaera sp.]